MCDKAFFFEIGLAYTNLNDINKKSCPILGQPFLLFQ